MPNKNIEPEEMNNLQKQLANDSFVNEGGAPMARAKLKEKETALTNNTRVVYSEEANREGSLDDG